MSYPTAYEDLELALANGESMIELGQVPGVGGEGELEPYTVEATDEWVQSQPDIHPGDPPRGPYGEVKPGFEWPGAVPIRPSRWDLESQSYRVAPGDTIAGLSATYLGTPQRLMEIWLIQPSTTRAGRSADVLYPEEWLLMPDDAVATLRAAVGLPPEEGGGQAAPPPPGGWVVTEKPAAGSSVATAQEAEKKKKYLIAGAAVGGGLLLLWALS